MTRIDITDIETNNELSTEAMSHVAGGVSFALQQQLNQFGAQLNRNAQYLFDPRTIYGAIRTSQIAYRTYFGRQMPYFFPMPQF